MRKNIQIGIRSNFHLLLGLIIDKPHRVPDACVFAPYRCEPMHSIESKGTLGMIDDLPVVGAYGHKNTLASFHREFSQSLTRLRNHRVCKRDHIVFPSASGEVVDDWMEAQRLLYSLPRSSGSTAQSAFDPATGTNSEWWTNLDRSEGVLHTV